MAIRPPELSTGLLIIAAIFTLILNIGLAALLTGSPFIFDLVMGMSTLAVGGAFSAYFQPWLWWERKD